MVSVLYINHLFRINPIVMNDQTIDEVMKSEETPDQNQKRRKKPGRIGFILLGLLTILILAGIGSYGGYLEGIRQRKNLEKDQVAIAASTQYQLGLIDEEAGRYQMAIKRYEYVINLDPSFPDVADHLANAMIQNALKSAPTKVVPTATPVPEITPTPDTRNEEELFANIESFLQNSEWEYAIETLDRLRKLNPEYHAVELDGMYYIAYRNLGVKKILNDGNLEGGMYDLSIAERFGRLDIESTSYRNFARYYIMGASFWEIDWGQVVYYFSMVYPSLPNLHDGSGYTATERYRIASLEYGEKLYEAREFCDAAQNYQNAYQLNPNEEGLSQKLEKAQEMCESDGNESEKSD